MLLFIVNSFYFENHWSCSIRTAGNYCIFFFHPALHYGASLQTCINISCNGIPSFGTERHLRTTCNGIWICTCCFDKCIQSHMPEVISFIIPVENKFITNIYNKDKLQNLDQHNTGVVILDIIFCL